MALANASVTPNYSSSFLDAVNTFVASPSVCKRVSERTGGSVPKCCRRAALSERSTLASGSDRKRTALALRGEIGYNRGTKIMRKREMARRDREDGVNSRYVQARQASGDLKPSPPARGGPCGCAWPRFRSWRTACRRRRGRGGGAGAGAARGARDQVPVGTMKRRQYHRLVKERRESIPESHPCAPGRR